MLDGWSIASALCPFRGRFALSNSNESEFRLDSDMTENLPITQARHSVFGVKPKADVPPYSVRCKRGLRFRIAELVDQLTPSSVLVVTDEVVSQIHGGCLNGQLKQMNDVRVELGKLPIPVEYFEMPAHRVAKNLDTAAEIFGRMFDARFNKDTLVLNFGGGTVGDMGGLVAALYLRGVRYVHVPTTLIGQADSGVGGKVNANFGTHVNCISVFHHPTAVWIDPDFLVTLPDRQLRSGLSEIVKYAVVMNNEMFETIESSLDEFSDPRSDLFGEVLSECLSEKCKIVENDPSESADFRLFNYGHELGHAVEVTYGYEHLLHGEAVAIGMCAAAWIGVQSSITDPDVSRRQFEVLTALSLPTRLPPELLSHFSSEESLAETITQMLGKDKKRSVSGPCWILPTCMGTGIYTDSEAVEPRLVRDCIRKLAAGIHLA